MSNQSNMTADKAETRDGFFVAQIVCYCVISIVGSLANLVICVGLTRGTMKSSEYFILNLAIADLLVCAIGIPLDIYLKYADSWPYGAYPCHLIYPSQTMLILISIMTLMGMSLERHRAICTPFKQRLTPKQIRISIVLIWLIAIAAVAPYANALKYSENDCTENWSVPENAKYYTLTLFVIDYCVPLSIITYCYVRAGYVLHTKFKKLSRKESTSVKHDLATMKRFKQNKKVIQIFSTAVMLFVICVLPGDCYWMWNSFRKEKHHPYDDHLQAFSTIMLYANSAINPFIFGAVQMICHRKMPSRFSVQLTSTTVLSRSKGSANSDAIGSGIQRSSFSRQVVGKHVKYKSLNTRDDVADTKSETNTLNNTNRESGLGDTRKRLCDKHSLCENKKSSRDANNNSGNTEHSLQARNNNIPTNEIGSHDTENIGDTGNSSRNTFKEFLETSQDTSNLQMILKTRHTDGHSQCKWNESLHETRSISSDSCATLHRESDAFSVTSDTAQNTNTELAERAHNTNGKRDWNDNTENGVGYTENGECYTENGECYTENGECNKENGECNTENGEWDTENGECYTEDGECNKEIGECNTKNGECNTGNGVCYTENGECSTGNGVCNTKNRTENTGNGAKRCTKNGRQSTENRAHNRESTNSILNVEAEQRNRRISDEFQKEDTKPGQK